MRDELTFWDVLKEMSAQNSQGIRLAPIDQITHMQKVKKGTKVTVGVAGDVINIIANGEVLGGFLMVDRKEYQRTLNGLRAKVQL